MKYTFESSQDKHLLHIECETPEKAEEILTGLNLNEEWKLI